MNEVSQGYQGNGHVSTHTPPSTTKSWNIRILRRWKWLLRECKRDPRTWRREDWKVRMRSPGYFWTKQRSTGGARATPEDTNCWQAPGVPEWVDPSRISSTAPQPLSLVWVNWRAGAEMGIQGPPKGTRVVGRNPEENVHTNENSTKKPSLVIWPRRMGIHKYDKSAAPWRRSLFIVNVEGNSIPLHSNRRTSQIWNYYLRWPNGVAEQDQGADAWPDKGKIPFRC
jgi:hypothetical protein